MCGFGVPTVVVVTHLVRLGPPDVPALWRRPSGRRLAGASEVIAAAYDLKEGLRRTPPRQRGLLARLWLRRLRASVRAGGMARGGGFLEDVYRGTFGRGREERSPSRGVFIHEFFVPGQCAPPTPSARWQSGLAQRRGL